MNCEREAAGPLIRGVRFNCVGKSTQILVHYSEILSKAQYRLSFMHYFVVKKIYLLDNWKLWQGGTSKVNLTTLK